VLVRALSPRGAQDPTPPGYLHGYSADERARLGTQARTLARWVHRDLPLADRRRLLEVGCGTGAQLELLLEAFPHLRVTGVDRAADQLAGAAPALARRAALVHADATALPFDDGAFDAAFLCWILEHVADPLAVLRELHRVLEPGAQVVVTEVVNATLGARLGHYLHHAGLRAIETRPADVIFDDRDPRARAAFCAYAKSLFLSAAPELLTTGRVSPADLDAMCAELDVVGREPGSVFFYAFVQGALRALTTGR
jgi:SAM-dependent methyltransferase